MEHQSSRLVIYLLYPPLFQKLVQEFYLALRRWELVVSTVLLITRFWSTFHILPLMAIQENSFNYIICGRDFTIKGYQRRHLTRVHRWQGLAHQDLPNINVGQSLHFRSPIDINATSLHSESTIPTHCNDYMLIVEHVFSHLQEICYDVYGFYEELGDSSLSLYNMKPVLFTAIEKLHPSAPICIKYEIETIL